MSLQHDDKGLKQGLRDIVNVSQALGECFLFLLQKNYLYIFIILNYQKNNTQGPEQVVLTCLGPFFSTLL